MDTLRTLILAAAAIALAAGGGLAWGQDTPTEPDTIAFRALKWTPEAQTSWITTALDRGIPSDMGDVFTMLVLNKSALTLPLMERKIEQVMQSQSPSECFTDESVDPAKFVALAAIGIAYAGNEDAMKEVAKLIRLDEARFDDLVGRTLNEAAARSRINPISLAYRGLDIDSPPVVLRVHAWFRGRLAEQDENSPKRVLKWWAEAMVERYHGVPTRSQWAEDPFVARLSPAEEPNLREEMLRLTIDAVQPRAKL